MLFEEAQTQYQDDNRAQKNGGKDTSRNSTKAEQKGKDIGDIYVNI
jgi:hypothetical protein|tara:strand:- start:2481 stop:2618 length:138 start_codon:yes stop_codon:yes gene_type:complete